MQIFGLHRSIYKLNRFISPEQNPYLNKTTIEVANRVSTWQRLKAHSVPDKEIASITSMSRATFYRYKKAIETYGLRVLERRSKKPKSFRKSKVAESTLHLILKLRCENPTYGKAKIVVLLKRDHCITNIRKYGGKDNLRPFKRRQDTQISFICKTEEKT